MENSDEELNILIASLNIKSRENLINSISACLVQQHKDEQVQESSFCYSELVS